MQFFEMAKIMEMPHPRAGDPTARKPEFFQVFELGQMTKPVIGQPGVAIPNQQSARDRVPA